MHEEHKHDFLLEAFSHLDQSERYLLGVSGGSDSVALVHMMVEFGFENLLLCHFNHRLRGKESDQDERFVKKLGLEKGLRVEVAYADVRALMAEKQLSLETAGRLARHKFFAELADFHQVHNLVLGHHADDQAETILWNLIRGGKGLRGMQFHRKMHFGETAMCIERPLLKFRKAALQDWLIDRKFIWREDNSNFVGDVVRNRLRLEAIPLLDDISKRDVVPLINRALSGDREQRELMDWALERSDALDPQGRLHVKALKNLPTVLQKEVIARFLKESDVRGIRSRVIEAVRTLLESDTHPGQMAVVNLEGGRRIRRRQGRIFLE